MDTLQRIPGVNVSHSFCIWDATLIYIQVLVPPGAALAELFLDCTFFAKGRQGFFRLLNGIFIVRERPLDNAKVVVRASFRSGSDGHMAVQGTARLTTIQVRVGKLTAFYFDGIPLVPVIAAEVIPVAAVRIASFAGAEVHQRGFSSTRVHPCCVGIGDRLQFLVKNGAGVPFQVIAKGILLFGKELGKLHIGVYIASNVFTGIIFQLQIPQKRIIVLRHEQLQRCG